MRTGNKYRFKCRICSETVDEKCEHFIVIKNDQQVSHLVRNHPNEFREVDNWPTLFEPLGDVMPDGSTGQDNSILDKAFSHAILSSLEGERHG